VVLRVVTLETVLFVTDKMYMKPLSVEHETLILRVMGSSLTLVDKFM